MSSITVKYEAAIKNKKEQDYCKAVVDALTNSKTVANQITFARKTKSYGSTGVAMYRATRSRDKKVKEIWVNLGKISNTTTLTRNPNCDFDPDFSTINKIVDYAESDRLSAWFNK
jgi:hypothetical protein